jgi:uncharacterized SAM-binding protein YcdF (DUF218 family)
MNNISSDTQKLCEIILNYLTITDKLNQADAIFISGGKSIITLNKAYEIYKQGIAHKIVFVGKKGPYTDPSWRSEADEYSKRLTELGVSSTDLIWEPLSTNTLDDTKYCMHLLTDNNINPRCLILVTRPFHQRRVYATFKKQYPETEYINAPSDEEYPLTEESIKRLLAEIDRIIEYGNKGDLEKQTIPLQVSDAHEQLKNLFLGV